MLLVWCLLVCLFPFFVDVKLWVVDINPPSIAIAPLLLQPQFGLLRPYYYSPLLVCNCRNHSSHAIKILKQHCFGRGKKRSTCCCSIFCFIKTVSWIKCKFTRRFAFKRRWCAVRPRSDKKGKAFQSRCVRASRPLCCWLSYGRLQPDGRYLFEFYNNNYRNSQHHNFPQYCTICVIGRFY